MERPGLQKLLADVKAGKLDVIVVYKVDRLTRSLADFAKLVELFDAHQVSFVSVTQSFNTTTSMGRLTLNVLLSFAQFEREVTGERIRDKIAASKKKGLWMGGVVPHGYRVENRKLVIEDTEAENIRLIFELYCQLKSIPALIRELENRGIDPGSESWRQAMRLAASRSPPALSPTCWETAYTSERSITGTKVIPVSMNTSSPSISSTRSRRSAAKAAAASGTAMSDPAPCWPDSSMMTKGTGCPPSCEER